MAWKKQLESISESVNEHIRFQNEFLMVENRALRQQISSRVQFTDRKCKKTY